MARIAGTGTPGFHSVSWNLKEDPRGSKSPEYQPMYVVPGTYHVKAGTSKLEAGTELEIKKGFD